MTILEHKEFHGKDPWDVVKFYMLLPSDLFEGHAYID